MSSKPVQGVFFRLSFYGGIAIGKNPAFQFYPGDWTRDLDDYPLEIEGAWIRICCRLHWSNPYGSATKSLTEWAYVLRTHPNKAGVILKTLLKKHIATGEYLDNQNITISSKRMMEDDRIRKIRQEVGKLGGNPQLKGIRRDLVNQIDNQKPTPSSSSSSSSSIQKKIYKRKVLLPDEEWIKELQGKECYSHLRVNDQFQRCTTYFETKGQSVSRRRFLVWLNDPRNAKPMQVIKPNGSFNKQINIAPSLDKMFKDAIKEGWK